VIDPERVRSAFRDRHGPGREVRLFAAPGRVNLIGEHTDYNEGFVLPVAIDRGTVVAAAPRADRLVRARSLDLDSDIEIDLDAPGRPRRGQWIDYVEGMARALAARGVSVSGADLVLASDVPRGAGLSSSAALEMATGLALAAVAGHDIDRLTLALAGQAAEHEYVGTQCGIMDQFIAALGMRDHALLIDCRLLESTLVPLDLGSVAIVLCDSGVVHELASSAYNIRRAECEQAVALLRGRLPAICALRDVTPGDLAVHQDLLAEPIRRRARHVVSENARTLAAAEAIGRGELAELGRLLAASHVSLRDDFEVSCAELDLLAEIAAEAGSAEVLGGRMTGGGFGGCTVNLVASEAVERFQARTAERFADRFARRPGFLVTRASDGARELS
jgi:galactokinase